jgi:hypothetical protein
MTAYGAFTWGSPIYASSMDINLNAIWGAVMLVFGGVMLWLSRRKR